MPGELIGDGCSDLALATNFANGILDWQATSTTESANFAASFILEVEAWILKEEVEGRDHQVADLALHARSRSTRKLQRMSQM